MLTEVLTVMGPWPGVRNVVCHGDVWTNNFMFRSDASGRPVEVSMVDYQLARYTPPPNDLVIMMAFCVDRATQEQYWDELKRLHWDTMAQALRRAGCDPDKVGPPCCARARLLATAAPCLTSRPLAPQVLPWAEYDAVAEKMWKYGLLLMALEHPFSLATDSLMQPLLVDPEKFHHHCHVDRSAAIINLYKTDSLFHARYNETMERVIDRYILAA